jgi:hypothetical protein
VDSPVQHRAYPACSRHSTAPEGTSPRVVIHALGFDSLVGEDGGAYIVDALDALALRDNARVIVPAQSAVEVTLMPVVHQLRERHSSKGNVEGFMGDRLTFGDVINIVLPFLCAQADIPTMTEDIRGAMTKLRKLRNDLVHEGKRRASITTGEAIEAQSDFAVLLARLHPDKETVASFPKIAGRVWERKQGDAEASSRRLKAKLESLKHLKAEHLKAKLLGQVEQKDYEHANAEFTEQIASVEQELEILLSNKTTLERFVGFAELMLVDIAAAYERAGPEPWCSNSAL